MFCRGVQFDYICKIRSNFRYTCCMFEIFEGDFLCSFITCHNGRLYRFIGVVYPDTWSWYLPEWTDGSPDCSHRPPSEWSACPVYLSTSLPDPKPVLLKDLKSSF